MIRQLIVICCDSCGKTESEWNSNSEGLRKVCEERKAWNITGEQDLCPRCADEVINFQEIGSQNK